MIESWTFLFSISTCSKRLPPSGLLGAYLDATNQFFEKAVFVAQVELWKAATEIKKISDLQKNARRVGSFLPGIRDASLLQRHGIASRAELLGDLNALKQDGVDVDRFRKDLADLGSAIRRDVGTENYAQIGVYGKQADFEQFAAFAADFLEQLCHNSTQVLEVVKLVGMQEGQWLVLLAEWDYLAQQ